MPEIGPALARAPVPAEIETLRRRIEELESQLAQTQKLHAIGSLAGGVAHDFNNLLTAIVGYVSLLRQDAGGTQPVVEALDVIEKATDRAAQLTSQLLGFARPAPPKRSRIEVHRTLHEVRDLLRHTIDRQIRLEVLPEQTPVLLLGDPSQLFQVFLNLAINARDAMPDGGCLTLAATTQGSHVRVTVADTGTGIPGQIRDRIFEPFFTTKEAGKGTGMGLTVVQTIVRSMGGRIEVECDPPPGTRFHVFLPAAPERRAEVAGDVAVPPARGKGSVLVVDDEEVVRQVAARMLKSLGYHAICLGSAHDALDYYGRRIRDIDLVLVDLVMPDLNGKALFEQLRDLNPRARVVLTSGYNQDAGVDALITAGAKGFLQKPYRLAQLSEVLSAAMLA